MATATMSTASTDTTDAPSNGLGKKIGALVVVAAVVTALVTLPVGDSLQAAQDWVAGLGPWGPIAFVGLYIVACVFGIPGSALTLGAGAIFGLTTGSVVVSIGATLGATAAFLVGRYFARSWVEGKIAGNEKFAAIDEAVAREGFKIVMLTRLSPAFPFTLLNYGYGVTKVGLRDYALASWIGMIPGTIMYVYLGTLAETATGEQTTGEIALKVVGLIATIAVTVYVTKVARAALNEKTALDEAAA